MSQQLVSPSEQEVVSAVQEIYSTITSAQRPGIAKLVSTLQSQNQWSLSEKRLKNILTQAGLRSATSEPQKASSPSLQDHASNLKDVGRATEPWVPKSKIDPTVPLPNGVESRYFGPIKGKGLVASRDFAEGEAIFIEEAYVPTPPPSAFKPMMEGSICNHCFLPIDGCPMPKRCAKACGARFCNMLCQSRAMSTHHMLLCSGYNPSIKPLLELIGSQSWQSLHSVARSIARILQTLTSSPPASVRRSTTTTTTSSTETATYEEVKSQISSFATVSELERRARNPGWEVESQSFVQALDRAWKLLRRGLDPFDEARLTERQLGRPSPFPVRQGSIQKEEAEEIFSWENFLQYLGRSNINMESHGGLYLIHSHLNHSCQPNVKIRHVPVRGRYASMKVAAVATSPIASGTELVISYVEPEMSVQRRRLLLWRDYCFGPCLCSRCLQELEALPEQERSLNLPLQDSRQPTLAEPVSTPPPSSLVAGSTASSSVANPQADKDLQGLEDELRASLGF
ncbi:SET domain-containing protein [Violaceomyces palustris]|uniref:SET domain-containing protein n=1 Tax=Violaceomyces palustris TaxID=1673888 RepID=A0ACD0NQB2_9BASI|nr:SET domain-containing protein [Violaceomyces palustris]